MLDARLNMSLKDVELEFLDIAFPKMKAALGELSECCEYIDNWIADCSLFFEENRNYKESETLTFANSRVASSMVLMFVQSVSALAKLAEQSDTHKEATNYFLRAIVPMIMTERIEELAESHAQN